jgi:glyoxylase-like metal-dependent hydrolase (beta-lactamase superfamily II)
MFSSNKVLVKPLFDRTSCTYTYLVWDNETKDALIIDAVKENLDRDIRIINELNLNLNWALETHIHADHITSAGPLAKELNAKVAVSSAADLNRDDYKVLKNNEEISIGESLKLKTIFTPGHTSCSVCFLVDKFLFTGDTLFIRGCGRTDFQQGSSSDLFDSVRELLFTLPDETIVLPGHDYKGEIFSTIGEEKKFNPRLNMKLSKEDFIEIMDNLNLALPAKIKESVPGNLNLGF